MTRSLQVQNAAILSEILKVFSALDDVRWSYTGNYNLINYCAPDFTPDEKLLSHWLCYVTDRQTAFERVWEVGGYVLSHLVRDFGQGFKSVEDSFLDHIRFTATNQKQKLHFEAPLVHPNPRLAHYDILPPGPVRFASRYMPTDAISILRTLLILEMTSGKSFTRFIYTVIHSEQDQRTAILKLAAALYFLTYTDIGQPQADELWDRLADLTPAIRAEATSFVGDQNAYIAGLVQNFKPFRKKRLWCSIRDYLKSPEFNAYLVAALNTIDPMEASRWNRTDTVLTAAIDVIELPGDVWNNNRTFREGLFTPYLGSIPKTWDMPQTVRALYNALGGQASGFYPEQLDVTFDFVPRMCDRRMCGICLFGAGVTKLCHEIHGLYCPVTLAACGYVHLCIPTDCAFKSNPVQGTCPQRGKLRRIVALMEELKVIIVVLRRPKSKSSDPCEMRTDPLWEFGSFGCTRCHAKNLMNPSKIDLLSGARLAFAQGGPSGFKLVHLTPSINIHPHGDFAEVKWLPVSMPFKYAQAPLLIKNTGESDFPLLKHYIEGADCSSFESRFASKFRSRRKSLNTDIANELIKVFKKKAVSNRPGLFASHYVEALPYNPPKIDNNRRQTYSKLLGQLA